MSEQLQDYVDQIKQKEQASREEGLINEEKFKQDYEAKSAQLKTLIEKDDDLSEKEKTELWKKAKNISEKQLQKLETEIAKLDVVEKEALKNIIERYNDQAIRFLVALQESFENRGRKEEFNIEETIQKDFKGKIKAIKLKIKLLEEAHRKIEEVKLEGGFMEAVFGKNQKIYQEQIDRLTSEIKADYVNLGIISTITDNTEGQKALDNIKTQLQNFDSFEHTTFWEEVGNGLTSKEGLSRSWDFLKNYGEGVGKGAIAMINPMTYYHLAQMMGDSTASLVYCDDNMEKIEGMIMQAGDAWADADNEGKAEMLGQFMGSILGVKGAGMALKAGRAKMLAGVEGTKLGINVGRKAGQIANQSSVKVSQVASDAKQITHQPSAKIPQTIKRTTQITNKASEKVSQTAEKTTQIVDQPSTGIPKAVDKTKQLADQSSRNVSQTANEAKQIIYRANRQKFPSENIETLKMSKTTKLLAEKTSYEKQIQSIKNAIEKQINTMKKRGISKERINRLVREDAQFIAKRDKIKMYQARIKEINKKLGTEQKPTKATKKPLSKEIRSTEPTTKATPEKTIHLPEKQLALVQKTTTEIVKNLKKEGIVVNMTNVEKQIDSMPRFLKIAASIGGISVLSTLVLETAEAEANEPEKSKITKNATRRKANAGKIAERKVKKIPEAAIREDPQEDKLILGNKEITPEIKAEINSLLNNLGDNFSYSMLTLKHKGSWDRAHEKIKGVQKILLSLGYDLGEKNDDGFYGEKTIKAVKKMQAEIGSNPDGAFGKKTKQKLTAFLSAD